MPIFSNQIHILPDSNVHKFFYALFFFLCASCCFHLAFMRYSKMRIKYVDGNVASNERQTRTCHRVLRCAQLFPQFVHVIRMDLLKERAAKPLGLQLVQNGSDRVRHVDNTTRLSRHHEQEAVSRLQNQVLQFLWPQTEGFKWCFKDFKSTFFVCILSKKKKYI